MIELKRNKDVKRFIIFRPGALGDTLAVAPVIWSLSECYPEVRLEYLSEQHENPCVLTSRQVLELIPEIDHSYLYNPSSDWRERLRTVRASVAPGPKDTLLYLCYQRSDLKRMFRDWIFFILVGFRHFAGFKTQMIDAIRGCVVDPKESEYNRLFRVLKGYGLHLSKNNSGSLLTDDTWVERFWNDHDLNDKKVVAVCPGSKMQSKRWPWERYASVISVLAQENEHLAFILIGNEHDKQVSEEICRALTENVISAIGATLLQTSSILSRVKVYIGNDTGPMHMAALHKVPCVAIFSARDRDGKWSPWSDGHEVLRADVPCACCMLQECYANPPVCLAKISENAVIETAKRILF